MTVSCDDVILQDEETLIQQRKEFQVMLNEQEKVRDKIRNLYVHVLALCAGVPVESS